MEGISYWWGDFWQEQDREMKQFDQNEEKRRMKKFLFPALFFIIIIIAVGCQNNDDTATQSEEKKSEGFTSVRDIETREDGLTYRLREKDPFTGLVVTRNREWQPRYLANYEDGKLHGPEMRWHENGRLRYIYDYQHGEKVRHREWFENGNPKIDAMMRDGVAYGKHTKWFEDGRLRFSAYFVEDLLWDGPVKDYAEDGTLMWDAVFKKGHYVSGIYPAEEEERLRAAGLIPPKETKDD